MRVCIASIAKLVEHYGMATFDKHEDIQYRKIGPLGCLCICSQVCAPRWVSLNIDDFVHGPVDKTRAHGRCFIAGRDMRNFKLLRPCSKLETFVYIARTFRGSVKTNWTLQ